MIMFSVSTRIAALGMNTSYAWDVQLRYCVIASFVVIVLRTSQKSFIQTVIAPHNRM